MEGKRSVKGDKLEQINYNLLIILEKIMNEAEFWRIIETANYSSAGDGYKQADLLVEYLSQLSEGEILDFDYIFNKLHDEAYDYNLWAAAYIIGGGCSDDGFTDFRAWLIAQGQEVYEKALAEPESLADYVESGQDAELEVLNYVSQKAYELKTGTWEMPRKVWVGRREPKGQMFKEENLPEMYPKLEAKFSDF
jgi:hypothetical protein